MEFRPFGQHGPDVSVIGMGTWKMQDAKQMQRALSTGLEAGMNHIDTAELYAGSEAAIAPVLRDHGRESVFLVSKVKPENATFDGTKDHCFASLDRLGTSYLDAYLLHWVGQHPIEETMNAMAELVDDGKVRQVGVSNFRVDELEEANDALGGIPLACNQVIYHPGERRVENDVLPWCKKNGVAVVGYSSFASGRIIDDEAWAKLDALGEPHGKSAGQVILDCLTRDPSVFLIPKSESVAHTNENAQALDHRLPKDVYDAFDEMFPVEGGEMWRF